MLTVLAWCALMSAPCFLAKCLTSCVEREIHGLYKPRREYNLRQFEEQNQAGAAAKIEAAAAKKAKMHV